MTTATNDSNQLYQEAAQLSEARLQQLRGASEHRAERLQAQNEILTRELQQAYTRLAEFEKAAEPKPAAKARKK